MKSFMKKILIGSMLLFFGFSGCVFAMGGDTGSSQWIGPPALTSGWGTSPSLQASTIDPLAGVITVGSGSPGATAVLTFTPAAPNGFMCFCADVTTLNQETCFTASSTTTAATLSFTKNAAGTFSNAAPVAADKIVYKCIPY